MDSAGGNKSSSASNAVAGAANFLGKINPLTYVYIVIVVLIVIFVVRYWPIIKAFGPLLGLMALLPFLADGIAALFGGIGAAYYALIAVWNLFKKGGASDQEAKEMAEAAKDQVNENIQEASAEEQGTLENNVKTTAAEEVDNANNDPDYDVNDAEDATDNIVKASEGGDAEVARRQRRRWKVRKAAVRMRTRK